MYLFLALVAFFILVLAYIFFIEPKKLVVREERIAVNPNAIHGSLRILFVSDLHIGWATSWKQVKAKLDILHKAHQEKHYNLLLLGGDYLDVSSNYLPLLKQALADLKTMRVPMFAVIGNHDHDYGTVNLEEVLEALKAAGVKVLRNEAELLKLGKEELVLVGIDDLELSPEYTASRPAHHNEYKVRAELLDWYHPHDRFHPHSMRVVLSHNPDAVYMQGTVRPDVVVSGHTHGGQFAFLDWFSSFFRKLKVVPESSFLTWAGRHLIHGTTLLVGRGFATSIIPGRFLRPAEVLSITLEKAQIPAHLIIGFSGKPGSGKDTAARVIQSQLPGIKMVGFSDAIRDEFDAEYGTNTRLSEREKYQHRTKIQEFGAGKVKQDINYWIKRVLAHQPPILITGVRRVTEAKAIQEAGGKLIRIEVSEETQIKRMGEEHYHANKNHDNETQLDNYSPWDFVVENNGTQEEFEQKILELVDQLH